MAVGFDTWLELVGSAVFLGLAVLAGFRGKHNPLARVLGLLCLDLFAYTLLSLLSKSTEIPAWRWRERAAAAMAAPLGLHLIVAFVGARRRLRWLLALSYLYFAAIGALCVLQPWSGQLIDSTGWARWMLAGMLPVFAIGTVEVIRHYRRERNPEERHRTHLTIGAIALGVGGAATDLVSLAGVEAMPRLASVGLTLSALVLSAAMLRIRLIEGRTRLAMLNALVVGALGVVAQIALFALLGAHLGFLAVGTVVVFLTVVVAARPVFTEYTARRERTAYLVTLGKLSAQMAHDVRNPLAAIRGGAQYLEEELRSGRGVDGSMVELIIGQADRLESVIANYRRYGRVEPELAPLELNEVVESALRACETARERSGGVTVVRELADDLPACAADPDLVSGALENLIRNAWEAMPRGGTLRVRTERVSKPTHQALRVIVGDSGAGMDPRAQEQAFESFFTTKESGTGLGLPFVRRVAEVHRGAVSLCSQLGEGTTVTFEIHA